MIEVWKTIDNYNRYEVSNYGNVRYKDTKILLKQYEIRKYLYVSLYDNKKTKHFRVHRLVAKTFLKDFTDKCVIMHLDNNTKNNRIDNLKCGTQSENIIQSYKENRDNKRKVINQYDLDGNFIKKWHSQLQIQKELGYRQNFISMCCNNKRKYAYGYIWRFNNE